MLFENFQLGRYYYAKSAFHKFNPAFKLVCLSFFSFYSFFTSSLPKLLSLLLFCFFLYAASRLKLKMFFLNLKSIAFIIFIIIFIHASIGGGEVIYGINLIGLSFTKEGIISGLIYALRLMSAVSFMALFTLTTTPIETAKALNVLLKPLAKLNIKTGSFITLITLTLRFFPFVLQSLKKIHTAQISRGVPADSLNLMLKLKSFAAVIVPAVLLLEKRSLDMALALEQKKFSGEFKNLHLTYSLNDFFIFLFLGAVFFLFFLI